MGAVFSNNNNNDYDVLKTEFKNYKQDINELIEAKLYEKIDSNNDGVVTHTEFDIWKDEYKQRMNNMIDDVKRESEVKIETIKDQFRENLAAKDAKIKNLENMLNAVKSTNQELEKYNIELIQGMKNPSQCPELKSIISKTKINEYVNEILENEDINISGLPDSIEKAIYKNVIRIILIIMDKMTDKATFDLLGHELRLVIH